MVLLFLWSYFYHLGPLRFCILDISLGKSDLETFSLSVFSGATWAPPQSHLALPFSTALSQLFLPLIVAVAGIESLDWLHQNPQCMVMIMIMLRLCLQRALLGTVMMQSHLSSAQTELWSVLCMPCLLWMRLSPIQNYKISESQFSLQPRELPTSNYATVHWAVEDHLQNGTTSFVL